MSHPVATRLSSPLFGSQVNDSSARETMSYTSLVRTGAQTGFVTYARRLPGKEDAAFSMPFTIKP